MPNRVHARVHRILPMALLIALPFAVPAAHAACPPIVLSPLASYPSGVGPVETVVADFTGDGIPDVAVTESRFPDGPGSIAILPGHGVGGVADGTLETRIPTAVGGVPLGLATADLDGDGHADLIVGNWRNNSVQVLLGLGNGTFKSPVPFGAGERPYEVVTGDFNADGVTDLAVADNGENRIRVLIGGNDGAGHWDGAFATPVEYATSNLSLSIAAGDLNNDGITDLVATESYSQSIAVFLGRGIAGHGDGTFDAAVHVSAGLEPYDLATGDFNADGRLDVVVSNSNNDGVRVLLGAGTGLFSGFTNYLSGFNCSGVAVSDLDGDGILDLAVTSAVSNNVQLLKGNGTAGVGDGSFAGPIELANCCFPLHVGIADLNQDGRPDVLSCNYSSNAVGVFLGSPTCVPDPRYPVITRIRDVPNDQGGKVFATWLRSSLDVASGAVNTYTVWRQVPDGVASARALPAIDVAARSQRSQVVTRANGTSDIVYWEALATLPAHRLAGYGYTAATPQDSLPSGNPLFTYQITANTSSIDVFYDSDPASGYSVDNIPPETPGGFSASWSSGAVQLQWNASAAPDFENFRLYRSTDASFVPSPATLLSTLTTPGYSDQAGSGATYKLVTVDLHGNASPSASAQASNTTGVAGGRPGTTWLASPAPNPMRSALEVRYALGRETRMELALFDNQGRHIRTLVSGVRPAGDVTLEWDARDDAGHAVSPGLYFLELRADRQHIVRRVTLVH